MPLSALRLYQLASASLPVGSFTYSQGLEWACEAGWVRTLEETRTWLHAQLHSSVLYCDLPILKRLYEAAAEQQADQFQYWTQELLSYRETSELRAQERQKGEAFRRFLQSLPDNPEDELSPLIEATQLAGMAWYACRQGIELIALQQCWLFSWLEGSVMAAIKLVPLGHQAGQALIYDLCSTLPTLIGRANQLSDDELGDSFPLVSIASACHETQYTRLFRS